MAKKNNNARVATEIGAGLVAVGAAAALGYYFYGSGEAKKHRKLAAKWASELKQEVIREAKNLKEITPADVAAILDKALHGKKQQARAQVRKIVKKVRRDR